MNFPLGLLKIGTGHKRMGVMSGTLFASFLSDLMGIANGKYNQPRGIASDMGIIDGSLLLLLFGLGIKL